MSRYLRTVEADRFMVMAADVIESYRLELPSLSVRITCVLVILFASRVYLIWNGKVCSSPFESGVFIHALLFAIIA